MGDSRPKKEGKIPKWQSELTFDTFERKKWKGSSHEQGIIWFTDGSEKGWSQERGGRKVGRAVAYLEIKRP